MSLYTSIDGTKKSIDSLYTGIDGVKKEILSLYSGEDGVKQTVFSQEVKYVIVGEQGLILTSGDGSSWIQRESGTTADLYKVIYGNGQWLVIGESILLASNNAREWTTILNSVSLSTYSSSGSITSQLSFTPTDILYVPGYGVGFAIGQYQGLISSDDEYITPSSTWSNLSTGFSSSKTYQIQFMSETGYKIGTGAYKYYYDSDYGIFSITQSASIGSNAISNLLTGGTLVNSCEGARIEGIKKHDSKIIGRIHIAGSDKTPEVNYYGIFGVSGGYEAFPSSSTETGVSDYLSDGSYSYIFASSGKVYRKSNSESKYSIVCSSLPPVNLSCYDNTKLYAVGNGGIFYTSTNNGESWQLNDIPISLNLNWIEFHENL